eukprot:NODE_12348_length_1230_cov_2.330009.p1 GENE.NODE_12348_length_1230_cov_2.330009~~NODE_12348_length_1230_cov_2.330009.p1  ORF type:complete len:188 (+),score=46.56 NODE_12348_length_1230_cov_2.330009:544-1107(+)
MRRNSITRPRCDTLPPAVPSRPALLSRPSLPNQQPLLPVPAPPPLPRPDRHFEAPLLVFSRGSDRVSANEECILQMVVSTLEMRPALRLDVVGCRGAAAHFEEEPGLPERRVESAVQWFAQHGVRVRVTKVLAALVSDGLPAGVFCRIFLDDDAALQAFFRESGNTPDGETSELARWLQARFRCCLT